MKALQHDVYYSGLSGLQLHIPQYLFPPPYENASRLTYYASFFNSIEFNSTFYKLPRAVTVSKWHSLVPDNFRFTFKLWKEITHIEALDFNPENVAAFFNTINAVQEKKGCVLIQFPPRLSIYYMAELKRLLACIKEIDPAGEWKIALEFRNKTWYHHRVYELIDAYKAAVVIHDIPKSSTPMLEHTADFIYVRLHGPTGNYRESYGEDFLHEYISYIKSWIAEGKTVYVYFNNTMGDALNNLKTLNRLYGNE